MAALPAAVGYGVFLIVTALRLPSGADLTGPFTLQPAVKALTAAVLAAAALSHPFAVERRWLIGALVLAVPIWVAYAASLLLITAGFIFGRSSGTSAIPPA